MNSDLPTLTDDFVNALLRAGFGGERTPIDQGLVHPHPRARVLALRAAVRREIVSEPIWLNALADDDVDLRREALGLGAHHALSDVVLERIAEFLHDEDALSVDGAAFALGEHQSAFAVDALVVVATTHEDLRCRESAIAALGNLGDERGRAAVIAALDDKPSVRRRAIVALANFEGPDIEAALERARGDRDWQVRAAVDQLDPVDDDELA